MTMGNRPVVSQAWGEIFFSSTDAKDDENSDGYEASTVGFAVGGDVPVAGNGSCRCLLCVWQHRFEWARLGKKPGRYGQPCFDACMGMSIFIGSG